MSAPQVIVVGAGPAGVRAAEVLVEAGLRPVLIDEADRCGGQIYRQPPDARQRPYEKLYGSEAAAARALHQTFDRIRPGLDYRPKTLAWDIAGGYVSIHDRAEAAVGRLPYTHLILATGATDRPLPVKGWTLPGVFTLGAAQIALKSQDCLVGQRVCFVGTGPLLYLAAVQYARAGVKVVAVVDSGSFGAQVKYSPGLRHAFGTALRGIGFVAELHLRRIPVLKGALPIEISGVDGVERVVVRQGAKQKSFDCDAVALGYGLRSETQLADLAGVPRVFDAAQQNWTPRSGVDGRTPVPGVYVAGDGAGIQGAHAAELRGARAALALLEDLGRAADASRAKALEAGISRWARFRAAMDGMFPIPVDALKSLTDDVVICRCERITMGDIRRVATLARPEDVNRLKAFGRTGMGRCQGRYCGDTAQAILSSLTGIPQEQAGIHRAQAPIKPLPIGDFTRVASQTEALAEEAAQ